MQDKKMQLHHEAHEVKPGSAGRLTGFIFSPLNTLKNTEKYKYTSPRKARKNTKKGQYSLTMKGMKGMKINLGAPVV